MARVRSSWLGVVAVLAVACSVGGLDYADKTCPCPAPKVCDTSTNRCVDTLPLQPPSVCTPKGCGELGVECGLIANGCQNEFVDCGKCKQFGKDCVDNKCICIPKTCAQLDAQCGDVTDACGDTHKCGDCPPAAPYCSGSGPTRCGATPCTPKTCAQLGAECGSIGDGCGKVLACPNSCVAPASCGAGGQPNKCGCTANSCAQAGWSCGSGLDECGRPRTCADCDLGRTCSAAHKCECQPTITCAIVGWQCGSGTMCGTSLACGSCGGTQVCNAQHKCVN